MASKKAYILYVLKILQDHSDEHNPLTHQQIIDYAKAEYGAEMERKAVASCIELLQEPPYEYDIIKGNEKNAHKGVYLGAREFDANDVLYLNTYLLSARNVPASFAKRISTALLNTLSENYRKNFHEIYFMDKIDRTSNTHLPYTINSISHAIRHNKMISFKYLEYDVKGNLVPRKDKDGVEKTYTVSPHYLYNSLGKFYLLCTPKHSPETVIKEVTPFRVEFIDGVIELKDAADSIKKIHGYENFEINEFINTHPYVDGDNRTINMKLEILEPKNGIRYLKDWFGNSANIKDVNGKCIGVVKTTANSAFWWIMQYSTHYTLLEPKILVEKTRQAAENILKTYKVNN